MENNNELKKVEKNVKQKRLIRFYVLPFIALSAFLSIVIFLIIPKVSSIFASIEEIDALNDTLDNKNQELIELRELAAESNFLVSQLKIIDDTAPTSTSEVVVFRDKITNLIQNRNLTIISQRVNEVNINERERNNINGLNLIEIPIIFEIRGEYQNMVGFVEDISKLEDFTIVREMKLSTEIEKGAPLTTLELRIDKYQFSIGDSEALSSEYRSVSIDAKINDIVLKYIQGRK